MYDDESLEYAAEQGEDFYQSVANVDPDDEMIVD